MHTFLFQALDFHIFEELKVEIKFPISQICASCLRIGKQKHNSVLDSGVIHRPISDHSIVFVKVKVKKPKITPQYITTRSYKKYNADLSVTDLAKEADSLLTIFDQTDVDSKLNILNDTLQSVLS